MNNEKLIVDSSQLSTNTYPLYKDSGVEWLGQVPEHWAIKRLKDLSIFQSGYSIISEQIETEGLYPVYGGRSP
ncbi:MAG: hypothetical protein RJA86_1222 [Pseudomonadota bacterium]|jgi:type I restriction enzyme S subunit